MPQRWIGRRNFSARPPCLRAVEACARHLDDLRPRLEALGIPNVRSHQQLERFFTALGLLDCFKRDGKVSFDKELLAAFQDWHPAIPVIRAARRVYDLVAGMLTM